MPTEATVSKWGDCLAIRIPKAIVEQAALKEGDRVRLVLDNEGAIVLRPTRRRYELSELVSRITAKNRHRETDSGNAQPV